MPTLPNPKHEIYAQKRVSGMKQVDAYEAAGFTRSSAGASQLESRADVKERIEELIQKKIEAGEDERKKRREAATNASSTNELGLTKMWVLSRMMDLYECAVNENDTKSALAVLMKLGEEIGMFRGAILDANDTKTTTENTAQQQQNALMERLIGTVTVEEPKPLPPPTKSELPKPDDLLDILSDEK